MGQLWYAHEGMRVLFGILVAAAIGLLWATIAVARHIRQSRRSHDGALAEPAATGRPAQRASDLRAGSGVRRPIRNNF